MIAIGDPMLVLHSPEHGWKKCRCVNCAGEAVPELPPLEVLRILDHGSRQPFAQEFVKIGGLARDYKQAQAGREPGEDD